MLRQLLQDLESTLGRLSASAAMGAPYSSGAASGAGAGPERFSQWLDYCAWDEERKIFINRESLGFCLELRPQSGADEEMARVLTALYASAPAGTGFQFHLYASPDIDHTLKHYVALRTPSHTDASKEKPWAQPMAQQRAEHYERASQQSLSRTHPYLLRNFRLVLSTCVAGNAQTFNAIEDLCVLRDSVRATLQAGGFPSRCWEAADLINWVSALLDPHRLSQAPKLHYDEGRPLNDQMIDPATQMEVGASEIKLFNVAALPPLETTSDHPSSATPSQHRGRTRSLRLLSARSLPPRLALWNMGSLIGDLYQNTLQFPCPYLITLGVKVLEGESSRQWAMIKSARATTNAGSYMARFLPDLQERKNDWDIVIRALDEGRQLVALYHEIALFAPPQEITRAEQAARAIFRARGFELANDTLMMSQALIASLPMSLSDGFYSDLKRMKRLTTKTSANAIHMAPLIAEWSGTPTPVLLMGGRRGQLMSLDVYDNPSGNYNVAIAGTSGSGKSVLLNEIAAAYLATGARVWIIDVGRSYEKACQNFGGSFIEFNEQMNFSLNPFSTVEDIDEGMELLQPLLAQMVSPREPLNAFEYSTLGHVIKQVWLEKGQRMTIDDIYARLNSGQLEDSDTGVIDRRLKDLATMLHPYTQAGTYGRYFSAKEGIAFENDLVVLELEELKSKKDLQTVVLLIMMYRITRQMYFDRERKKIVIIDEAWDLLSGGSTAEFIEAGYRRARKYRGAFMSATQGIDDYYRNPAARAALDNSDWMFLLRQKSESIESMDRLGQLKMDDALKRLLQSLRTEQGLYSEVYIHSPAGSGIGRVLVDPYSLLLFSSRAEDFSAINAQRALGLSVPEAIRAVLQHRSQH